MFKVEFKIDDPNEIARALRKLADTIEKGNMWRGQTRIHDLNNNRIGYWYFDPDA